MGKPIKIAILADGSVAEKAAKGVGKTFEKVFGGLGKIAAGAALPVAGAAGVVGLGFASAFSDALDLQDAKAKLVAQLGFGDADSKKAGKIAGDLYKNAYGESLSDVNDTLATVFQSGLAKAGDAEDAIKGVTTQVLNYSTLTGEEALPVTRAVSQMLKTGLAKNATEAFDILTRGQQLGINKSEDLLDTFNEYGTQFRKLGIDGPTALGLMNQALQAGARDSDIAADAIKEFSIRAVDGSKTTVDGFTKLGLSADTMAEKFAKGGPQATAALGQVLDKLRAVKDPAEQSRIAVELFGTQAEDLGAALLAFNPSTAVKGLGQLQGAAARAGDTLNDTAKNKLTTISRTIKTTLAEAIEKYALPKLEKFADWFNGPGKFVVVSWALEAGQAFLDFSADMLGGLGKTIGGLAQYGQVAAFAAAASVALI
ncbi:phage tail tape measure protein, partial [Streptomyces sp. NPDC003952]